MRRQAATLVVVALVAIFLGLATGCAPSSSVCTHARIAHVHVKGC